MEEIKIGSIVKYSAKYLKNIGTYTGDLPFMEGEVLNISTIGRGINSLTLAEVKFNLAKESILVNINNLVLK